MIKILVGARDSPLSRVQFEEVRRAFLSLHYELVPVFVKTVGDLDKNRSLRNLEKTDFFTRELDQMLLQGEVRVCVHSAKDLPDPLPKGLSIVALTKSVDPRDSLVFREEDSLFTLASNAKIATSSIRREETVRALRSDLCFIDIRGNIGERLELLERSVVDGVVVAEAAILRLQLTHLNRMVLPGATAPYQGCLAVVARSEDQEMQALFESLQTLSFDS